MHYVVEYSYPSSSLCSFKSVGHGRFSLRLMFNSVTQLFSCPISRLWYMRECLFISSVTNGIWRSLCNVKFKTYHGALVMERRTFH
jgi:hypothetical protein